MAYSWLKAFFIPETGRPCYRVGPVGPVVLQAVLQTFGGTDGWDRWDYSESLPIRAGSIARRMPVPPVPPGGTARSRQILCSTTGTTSPTAETVQGTNQDRIAHHDDACLGPVPAVSSSIVGSST
jgi:hypothetical protein